MHEQQPLRQTDLRTRALIGGALLLVLIAVGVTSANAAGQIIPSVGISRAVNGDGGDDAQVYGGVAFRGSMTPFLMTELGVAYRQEDRFDNHLKIRQWPVTASLWLNPIPVLYAGGGVGWYQTSFDYDATLEPVLESRTESKFGVHLGGGLSVPMAPNLGFDVNGRYVFMDKENSDLPPFEFDPDFWTTTVGLAIKF